MDTIPKQLNFEVDPNLDATGNLDHKGLLQKKIGAFFVSLRQGEGRRRI